MATLHRRLSTLKNVCPAFHRLLEVTKFQHKHQSEADLTIGVNTLILIGVYAELFWPPDSSDIYESLLVSNCREKKKLKDVITPF